MDKPRGRWYIFLMTQDRSQFPFPSHWSKVLAFHIPLALLVLSPAGGQTVANSFKVPEIDENGVMKSLFTGEKAIMYPDKPTEVLGLTIEFFEEDGKTVEVKVTSPKCFYDNVEGVATSEETVRISGEDFDVEGKGYRFVKDEQRMQIFSDAKVTFRNVKLKPKTPSGDAPELKDPETP